MIPNSQTFFPLQKGNEVKATESRFFFFFVVQNSDQGIIVFLNYCGIAAFILLHYITCTLSLIYLYTHSNKKQIILEFSKIPFVLSLYEKIPVRLAAVVVQWLEGLGSAAEACLCPKTWL